MLVISVLRGGNLSAPLKFSAVDSTSERLVFRLSLNQLLGNDIKLWSEVIGIKTTLSIISLIFYCISAIQIQHIFIELLLRLRI